MTELIRTQRVSQAKGREVELEVEEMMMRRLFLRVTRIRN